MRQSGGSRWHGICSDAPACRSVQISSAISVQFASAAAKLALAERPSGWWRRSRIAARTPQATSSGFPRFPSVPVSPGPNLLPGSVPLGRDGGNPLTRMAPAPGLGRSVRAGPHLYPASL
jgi:hypothetical protein